MTQFAPLEIKLIETQSDKTENVRATFIGDASFKEETSFYLEGEQGKWAKYVKLKSAFRARPDSVELAIFVEEHKAHWRKRLPRYLSGLSDDTQMTIFLSVSLAAIGLLVGVFLFTDPILGFLVQWVGITLGFATGMYLMIRAAHAGWPPLFSTLPAVLFGALVWIGIEVALFYALEPEGGLRGMPRVELGQLLRSEIGAWPAIALGYASTLLVLIRAAGFAVTADIMATVVEKLKKDGQDS